MRPPDWFLGITRDWRIRTFVPVAAIHVIAFSALYGALRTATTRRTVAAEQAAFEIVLDESSEVFRSWVPAHGPFKGHGARSVRTHLAQVSRQHRNVPLRLFDSQGRPAWSSSREPEAWQLELVHAALEKPPQGTLFRAVSGGGLLLAGARVLRNDEACQGCHAQAGPVLGAIEIDSNLSSLHREGRAWAMAVVGTAAGSWLLLAGVMAGIRAFVIGRPLARMEEDLGAARPSEARAADADLDTLADRLHRTIWDLLERERARQDNVSPQMARAEQMAALGAVAAGLSHEIRNPLAGIRAAVEVLAREEADPDGERARVFGQIVTELDRVTHTVENLLRLARPQRASRMPSHLDQIVRSAATLYDPQLRQRGIQLSVEIAGPIPTLELDSDLVMQILVNLLTNASQAVGDGGHVTVTVGPFPQHDGAVLTVSDDGAGISPENLDRIFEPFFTTKAGGTGLGLPLCRQMVTQHGGSISVESRRGEGTRVVVLFPAARNVAAAEV